MTKLTKFAEKTFMIVIINNGYKKLENRLLECIKCFDSEGENFIIGKRNTIKLFEVDEKIINIKSFKKPHLINKIAYKYFRKSKARRSFEYANILLEKNICNAI